MKRLFLIAALLCKAASAQTLAPETTAKLNALCDDPKLADARLGISVMALGHAATPQAFPSQPLAAPKPLFERDAEKRFTPASNLKLYTAALALKSMGAGRRFTTRLWAVGKIENGVLKGHLLLFGSGDPSLEFADLDGMARQVHAVGIRRITGGVLLFPTTPPGDGLAENFANLYPDGWTLDDALWYYGPEVTALTVHRNQVDLTVVGGAKPGAPAVASVEMNVPAIIMAGGAPRIESAEEQQRRLDNALSTLGIISTVKTGTPDLFSKDEDDLLKVQRDIGGNSSLLYVSGLVAPGQKVTVGLAVPGVSQWAQNVFTSQLRAAGVGIPAMPTVDTTPINLSNGESRLNRVVATHDSPPVGELLKKFLKTSDNLYGELLLRLTARADLAARGKSLQGVNYANYAHDMLRTYLKSEGIDADGLRFSDGSGLSRYNLVTPHATAQLLAAVERIPEAHYFWDAMPIAGVDGTLKKRMQDPPAQNNVRAKTGTFSIVSCLSGYVTTRDGTRLAVSVMTNFARSGNDARRVQNEIFETLADASLNAQ